MVFISFNKIRSELFENYIEFRPTNVSIPASIDWRQHNYVTRVRQQGSCGSCWAFSAVGALEGQYRRATGELAELSPQNLLDCSSQWDSCRAGWPFHAFQYVMRSGISLETSYRYRGVKGPCYAYPKYTKATCKNFYSIQRGNELDLQRIIATYGPVSFAMSVNQNFYNYRSGIYSDALCSKTVLGHAMLIVGYGSDGPGRDYYIVKNSWDTWWGDHGYARVARNQGNMCGVATSATLPIVAEQFIETDSNERILC